MQLAKEDGYLTATWRTRLSPTMLVAGPDPFVTCPKRYKSFRNRLKGKLQRLSEQEPVSFETETRPTSATMERFLALESSGWKGDKKSAVASAAHTQRFYSDIWQHAVQREYARTYTMWLGSKPIAMQFGLLRNSVYYTPKVAYDEAYRDFSLGHILMRHAIQDISAAGAVRFDFLGPNALWKSVWTTSLQRHDNCFIFRPTLAGRAAHTALTQVGLRLRALRHRVYGDPQDLERK
jgi:CelD/BcsL family acetyltransferase involved in cellulose biosynthesis